MDARTPKTKETIAHFLKELEDPPRKLTPWERQFIESLTDQWERRGEDPGRITDRQFEILERLYAEKSA